MKMFSKLVPSVCMGITLLLRATAAGAMPTAPFILPTTFEGTTGCGTARDAADVALLLRADGTYAIRIVLKGRELSEGTGSWHVTSDDERLVLDSVSGSASLFQIADGGSLKRLYGATGAPGSPCFEILTRSAHTVEFSGKMSNVSLTSDLWTLDALGGKRLAPGLGRKLPTLAFDQPTKRLRGTTGCNSLGGSYELEGATSTQAGGILSKLTISPVMTTHIACAPPFENAEARLLSVLARTTSIHICCSTLELIDKGGTVLAAFRTSR